MNICKGLIKAPLPLRLITSVVGIYHSEDLYDEPLFFRPERYLESEFGTKPGADTAGLRHDLHFGSGRVEHSMPS